MKDMKCMNNFIMGLLLVAFVLTSLGMGFGEERQVFSSRHEVQDSKITASEITISGDLHTFEVSERTPVTFRSRNIRGDRSEALLRGTLLFLCVLTILSVFLKLIQSILISYGRLYVHERHYMIAFMQDMDGRKRIS